MVHLSSKFVMQYRCSTFGPPCLPTHTLHHKQKNQCENNPGIKIDKPGENQKNIEKTKKKTKKNIEKTKKTKKTKNKKNNNFRLFRKWGPSPRPSENCFFCFFLVFLVFSRFFGFLPFLQVFCWGSCEASLAWEGSFAKHVVFVMTRDTESMVTKTMNQG